MLWMPPDARVPIKKTVFRGDNTINIYRVGLWFLGSALPLIAIYLYNKLDLNAK